MTDLVPDSFQLPVSLRIRGSAEAIFEAWRNPALAERWLCDKLEGDWTPGQSIFWNFGEIRQELRILSATASRELHFRWISRDEQPDTEVRIEFRELGEEVGLVLLESGWPLTKQNVLWALDHACGWENIFCRLKAWIEFGVHLR